MPTPSEIIANAKRPERSVALCLAADLVDEHEELVRQLSEEKDRPTAKLNDGGTARRLAEQISQLEERMKDSTVTFRLRALPRARLRQLITEHPPTDGDEIGAQLGYDLAAVSDALVRESVFEPELSSDEWRQLLDPDEGVLTEQQFDELASAATALNWKPVDVPFSWAASAALRRSDET